MRLTIYLLITFFFVLSFSTLKAQFTIGNTSIDTLIIASNLATPWELKYSQDSSLWFTERVGKVSRIDLRTKRRKVVLDYQNIVEQIGESGMLGMELLFTTAVPKVFLVYTYRTPSNAFFERVSSFIYDSNLDTLINEQVLLDSIPANNIHNGSRLFIQNNFLYITTGDAANVNLSQDLTSLAGKVLRIHLNGSIPSTNPIQGSAIYSWGHRNAQGLEFANNKLYSAEHGPSTNDEINLLQKGKNYGWPNVEGFCNLTQEQQFCIDSNVVEPIQAWSPTIAPSDLVYYNHPAIPEWQNHLILTTLKNQRIYALQLNQSFDSVIAITQHFQNQWGRLRDIATNQYGELFIATNGSSNQIIKLYNPLFTSIKTPDNKATKISIYPNPTKDKVFFELNSKKLEKINLFELSGKLVKQIPVLTNYHFFSLKGLPKGLYLLQLQFRDGNTYSEKLLLQP